MDTHESPSVLIVDDDPIKLRAIELTLADVDCAPVAAHSGHEALRYLLQHDVAVILLDVNMPEMDGFETAALIRARGRSAHTPIIFISAISPAESYAAKGYLLGAVDYIFSPMVPEVLCAKVAVFVQIFRLTQTARDQAELLRQRTEDLERSNADLEQLAYVASHDLQEPLRMVTSYVQLLQQRYQGRLDAQADTYIGYAVDGTTRMQALIQDLLTYARTGRSHETPVPTDIARVLAHVLDDLAVTITTTHATILADLLPTVLATPGEIGQLLQNLISNALKFQSAESPQIHISATRRGQEWVIAVRDNGIGMDPQNTARIFEIFQRLHTRQEYPGTGIGLAICKRIVAQYGGKIWVESALGAGTTFFFTFPVAQGGRDRYT